MGRGSPQGAKGLPSESIGASVKGQMDPLGKIMNHLGRYRTTNAAMDPLGKIMNHLGRSRTNRADMDPQG